MLKCQQLLDFNIYEREKFHAQLSMKNFFITSGPGVCTVTLCIPKIQIGTFLFSIEELVIYGLF